MKQNLKQNLLIGLVIILIIAGLTIWHFVSRNLGQDVLDWLDDLKIAIVLILALAISVYTATFLFFNFFREVYVQSIRKRAGKLSELTIDKTNEFLYLTAGCYQSGPEPGDGYYIYHHYLFDLNKGATLKYRAPKTNPQDREAIRFFSDKLKREISIPLGENKNMFKVENDHCWIHVKPFKTFIDEGLEVICIKKDRKVHEWKIKI